MKRKVMKKLSIIFLVMVMLTVGCLWWQTPNLATQAIRAAIQVIPATLAAPIIPPEDRLEDRLMVQSK